MERSDNPEEDVSSDQVPTLALNNKSPLQNSSGGLFSNDGAATLAELHVLSHSGSQEKVLINGELGSPDLRRKTIVARKSEVKESSFHVENGSSSSAAPKSQDCSPQKVKFLCFLLFTAQNIRGSLILYELLSLPAKALHNCTHHTTFLYLSIFVLPDDLFMFCQ